MTHTGRARKRYLLLSTDSEVNDEFKDEVLRMMAERHPEVRKNHVVWLEKGFIVRSTNTAVEGLGVEFQLAARLKTEPRRTSGSISKLKKLVEAGI